MPVAYLYSLWADIPVSQVLDVPGGAAVVAAVMLAAGLLTARLAKEWGKKQMLEPLQMAVARFFPGVVVVLNIVLMVAGGRLDATRFAILFTAGLTAAVLVHLMFVQMLNEQVVQRKDSEYQARLEQERAEALLDSYTTQRRLTHEFTNHTEALSLMLQQGDVEGAKAYLADVGRTIQANTAILNSHNPLLDALLSKKYEEAARRGVMMYFDLSDLAGHPAGKHRARHRDLQPPQQCHRRGGQSRSARGARPHPADARGAFAFGAQPGGEKRPPHRRPAAPLHQARAGPRHGSCQRAGSAGPPRSGVCSQLPGELVPLYLRGAKRQVMTL